MGVLWPIVKQALAAPRRTAVIDDNGHHTYGDIVGAAAFIADAIDTATQAKHVGIILPTGAAFPMALLGAWWAGRTAVPLNYMLAPDELAYVVGDSDIDTIITVEPMIKWLRSTADQPGGGVPGIPDGVKLLKLEDMDRTGWPPLRWPPVPSSDDLAAILYTSGTSGRPKGVMLTHGNLRSNVDAAIDHAGVTSEDIFLGVLPQFHSFGLTGLTLVPLCAGARIVSTARFVPRRVVDLIRTHRPHLIVAVPSMYGALLSVKNAAADDLSSIRAAISGGEPLPRAVAEAYQERFGLRLLEGYGLTETSPMTNWSTPQRCRDRSVGPALPGVTIIIVDGHTRCLGPGEEGEVLIAGPNIMRGYYKLPDVTREVFVEIDLNGNGPGGRAHSGRTEFFRTGDIGKLDEDGYLYITGRKKEMLIIGGENVFPREIEEVLNRHPSVAGSAVIGRQDAMRGEVPIAFIEVQDGESFDEPALRAWCRDALAGYKVPREIHQIDALPRSPTGKILRRQLSAAQPVG